VLPVRTQSTFPVLLAHEAKPAGKTWQLLHHVTGKEERSNQWLNVSLSSFNRFMTGFQASYFLSPKKASYCCDSCELPQLWYAVAHSDIYNCTQNET